ncbi:hypothetical protein Srubr_66380 [Streptomyces rubradiris]|uniref:Uncharacterized protein n=1 Tax=Streptomyces rubradiris TaxID=285531 RepID=A0ABQ3RM18_STRRR|nr:hypothetical protein GCM10018792_32430 [Streptomyces rubradiris]GHI56792.1 hypothetical protein Srubr_66380 [Streptomyces rubradiris]
MPSEREGEAEEVDAQTNEQIADGSAGRRLGTVLRENTTSVTKDLSGLGLLPDGSLGDIG